MFFSCVVSFSHCRDVLHKGVDIKVGLKHREDEFSFVKLAYGCRNALHKGVDLKEKYYGRGKEQVQSQIQFKLCTETSACHRN